MQQPPLQDGFENQIYSSVNNLQCRCSAFASGRNWASHANHAYVYGGDEKGGRVCVSAGTLCSRRNKYSMQCIAESATACEGELLECLVWQVCGGSL